MLDTLTEEAPAHQAAAGEDFRDAAAAVAFDRIVGDCLDREWVIAPKPQPNKARHGRKSEPQALVEGEARGR
ncbi:hypothetical protein [Burkholderia gladioli]|uniref:hypothetical protein n=1 Tax=Burkholderia gladioli TaxID=28095 RepID=UPI00163FD097|nr:hypothetical protein [Burkholderia gladioli]